MNTKKLATLSTLAGGVLLILALFRGRITQLLLIAYLCLWTIIWVISWVREADNLDHKEERKPSSAPCMGTVELGRLLKNTVHSNGIGM